MELEDIGYLVEVTVLAIFSLIIFIHFIQPLLVAAHPMFAWQVSSGRYPDTLVGLAAVIMFFIIYYIYHNVFWYIIDKFELYN